MPNIIEPNTKFSPRINVSLEPQIDWAHGSVILGRGRQSISELGLKATMNLGVICEHQIAGASLFGYKVLFDYKFPHIIFICGKRGSGKSYTLGVIVEELGRSKSGIGTIVIDPLGTFWTMKNKNESKKASEVLSKYGLYPKDYKNIQVLTPTGFYEDMKASVDGAFSIAISDLSVDDWCLVFDIDRFKTQGLLIGDVLDKINNGYYAQVGKVTKKIPPKKRGYTIGDIIFCIKNDVSISSVQEGYAVGTRRSVIARFKSAAKWGIFSVKGTPLKMISIRNKITILDVSHSKLGSSRRALLVGILARKILEARIEASRMEEVSDMGISVSKKEYIPVTWLVIDEAHLLLPSSGKTPASESLIEFAKLGRKPGCGLVLATQRPAATNDDILSQVDTIVGHNLALEDDISALRKRIPAKIPSEFNNSDFIRSIPVGICLLADQKTQQRTMLIQIRPRITHHSGKAAMPKSDEEKKLEEQLDKDGMITKDQESDQIIKSEPELELEYDGSFSADDLIKTSIDISNFESENDIFTDTESTTKTEITEKIVNEMEEKIEKKASDKEIGDKNLENELKGSLASVRSSTDLYKIDESIIKWGGAYLIVSKNPEFGLNLLHNFSKETTGQYLSITRTHPNKLNKNLLPENAKLIWLSKSVEKDSVPPGNITKIAHIIHEFMSESEKNIIFLDGVEYLINNNNFQRILKFIEMVHEKVILNNGILMIPVNPSALAKNNLDLLENEVSNKITDPSIAPAAMEFSTLQDQKVKEKEMVGSIDENDIEMDKVEEALGIVKSDHQKVRSATKKELKALCNKLGLDTSGSVEDLKQRLLALEESQQISLSESGSKIKVETEKLSPSPNAKSKASELIGSETQAITEKERQILDLISEEKKALGNLIAERQKLQKDINRLRDAERKQKLQLEKQKILEEKERLKREKREFEIEKKRLEKDNQLALKQVEIEIRKGKSEKERTKEKVKSEEIGFKKKRTDNNSIKQTGELHKKTKDIDDYIPVKFKRVAKEPREPEFRPEIKSIRESKDLHGKGEKQQLIIKPRLSYDSIEEYAIKQLKTTILGKVLEVIQNIKPVYLPLKKVYIKAMRGSIFAKEHDGIFYWDSVTGEVITDVGNVLKRSKGLSILISLTSNQAKVLAAIETWGNNDIVEIQNETHITVPQIKRTLTELKKKSLVTTEQLTDKRMFNYKRVVELKYPKKFDKINVDMPSISKGNARDNIISPQFKISELEKLLNTIVPGTRIISSEDIFYPYYKVEIIGKKGPRTIILDSVSGNQDKVLTEYLLIKDIE